MTRRALVAAAVLLAFASRFALAQKDSGTLLGTVRDATGAVVPQARINVRNLTTNVESSTSSNSAGEYLITPLRVGEYALTVEAPGFSTRVFERVVLDVDQRLRVDVVLAIGTSQQRVTVTDVPPPLNTEDMTVGQVIQNRQIQDMPLNGRNFQQLASLVPGAIPSYGARDSGQGGVSLSGTRSFDNSFLLDGVNNTTNTAEMPTRVNVAVSPNLDAIQEFKIQSSNYDAQYGGSVAGTINIVTKSGTNQLHGTAYDYWRNSDLNANSWENNGRGIPRGFRNRNQFGGVVGGPVFIPGVYNGKNKTFFFADYEGVRDIMPPGLLNVTVPDQKMRAGDFSEFLPGSTSNPGGPTFVLGAPYVNNVLPGSQLDSVAKGLAALYPLPNVPGTLQYVADVPHTFDSANYGARLDHHLSEKDSFFARYTGNGLTTKSGTWNNLIGPVNQNKTDGTVLVLSETHLFSPTVVNEFRFGFSHARPYRLPTAPNTDLYSQLGLTGIPMITGMPTGLLRFNGLLGIQSIGQRSGYYNDSGIVKDYNDNLSFIRGKHSVHVGAGIRPIRFSHYESQAPRGDFQFFASDNAIDGQGNPSPVGFAQFLTGMPSRISFSTANDIIYRQWNTSYYAQDTYRITKSLTLNLGLRYEYYTAPNERHNNQANFDLDRGVLVLPSVRTYTLPASFSGISVDTHGSPGLVQTDKNNWAPRLGIAYSLNQKTVLRGGFGVYYGFQEIGPWSYPSPGYNPPFNLVYSPPVQPLHSNFALDPYTDPNAQFQIASLPAHLRTPRIEQWNFSLQRVLARDLTFEASYNGSGGHNLYTLIYFNQAYPGTTFDDLSSRLPYPYLQDTSQQTNNNGYSRYNAMMLKLEKRFSSGLSFLGSYTYGHALDNASDANLGSAHAGDTFRDPRHENWEYGNSDFDIRHRFVFSGIYDLPFGHGRRFASSAPAFANALIGGWQLNGIWAVQTGYWFTPFGVNDTCFCEDGNANSLRPDVVAGQNPNTGPKTAAQWFNLAAFNVDVPAGRHGNAGRNNILGPGLMNLDMGIHKEFSLHETARLQFRSDFFNTFNHVNLNAPVTDYSNANIGKILTSTGGRELQLALKLIF
ncbi:MAG: TonB-dependent receptor [Bryobacteraceae bacterium]